MYASLRAWMRRHPRVVDGTAVAPLVVLTMWGAYYSPYEGTWLRPLGVSLALCAPFVVRRRYPVVAFAVSALAGFVQWLLGIGILPIDLVLFAALYNVASRCRWEIAALAAAMLELGAVLAIWRFMAPFIGRQAWLQLITATIFIGSMWIWGNSVRTRRAYLAGLEERAVRLERERDNQAQIAAAAERARIARELHDVVSHSLSVIVVQADGAAYALETDASRAGQALATISSTGRQALTEMRRMLGVLRDGEAEQEYVPQPGVAQLDQLVEQARHAGLPVEFAVEGVPSELPTGMDLAAYRVAQEALTNTLKHAGPDANARVWLRYTEDLLEMRIRDDGRGAAARTDAQPDGKGLIGMRERVSAYGGSVRCGPQDGGGYEVVASLPLRATDEVTGESAWLR